MAVLVHRGTSSKIFRPVQSSLLGMSSWRKLPPLFFLQCTSVLCLSFSVAAADTLSVGESLTGNRTLVSEGRKFELGFFSPTTDDSRYYVGIWYKQIPGRTVIWVMNRDCPVSDPSAAELTVAPDRSLVLLLNGNHSRKPIWSSTPEKSNYTRSSNDESAVVAVLLDTGNLVLRRGRQSSSTSEKQIIWQSFEHPTDTLVPGGWVGLKKRTGAYQALVSWRSAVDPSTGLYMDRVDPHGSGQYTFMWNGTTVYHNLGAWNGQRFTTVPEMGISTRYKYISVDNDVEVRFSFQVADPSTVSRMVMSPHGQLTMFVWSDEPGQWLLHWATPTSPCDVYSVCGTFGLCDVASSQYCRCLPGFDAASSPPGDWSSGCARKTGLHCGNGDNASSSTDGFLPARNVKLPSSSYFSKADAGSPGDCELACLSNCSCTAYSFKGGCLVWGDGLRNVQQLPDGDATASTLFLRVAAADLAAASDHDGSTDARDAILIASSVAFLLTLCLFVIIAWRRRHAKTVGDDGSLLVFSHRSLARCTKNYSHKLGMGSFGSVYKGTLRDHTVVAVKRLELGSSVQGEKQFRAEVRTLGTIHHVNLVRLRGFGATKHERLLVYDYMPNGSLASALSGPSFGLLDWGTRFGIMAGVARGLAYLHEECQERIVHCDVKPENILLDSGFCPKVADFGMAKLIGRDFSRVLTTARGTVGYLAPEWILGLPVTAKADVYSYGMTLLELISGRRNRDTGAGRGVGHFPLWAATKAAEGRFQALLDERLAGRADMDELGRACNAACWCIQESEALRPTMAQVVQVLEGSLTVGAAPVPRYLELFCAEDSCTL